MIRFAEQSYKNLFYLHMQKCQLQHYYQGNKSSSKATNQNYYKLWERSSVSLFPGGPGVMVPTLSQPLGSKSLELT